MICNKANSNIDWRKIEDSLTINKNIDWRTRDHMLVFQSVEIVYILNKLTRYLLQRT